MSKQTRFSKLSVFGFFAVTAIVLVALVSSVSPSAAQSRVLDDARVAGTAGERFDGIAIARAGASGAVKQSIDAVNAQRLAIYRKRAASEGITTEAVGRIYAKQIYENAPSGTWFLLKSSQWVRK
jgi:uncharacterized protein